MGSNTNKDSLYLPCMYEYIKLLSFYFNGMFIKALVFPSFQGICCQRVYCVDCWSWTSTISVACSMILLSSLWLLVVLLFGLRVCSLIRWQVRHTAYALVISSPCSVANVIVSTLNSHQVHKQVFVHCISVMFEKTDRWKPESIITKKRKWRDRKDTWTCTFDNVFTVKTMLWRESRLAVNVIIVQYVAWIHLHAIYMKIRACTWKAQTVHHHSSQVGCTRLNASRGALIRGESFPFYTGMLFRQSWLYTEE